MNLNKSMSLQNNLVNISLKRKKNVKIILTENMYNFNAGQWVPVQFLLADIDRNEKLTFHLTSLQ